MALTLRSGIDSEETRIQVNGADAIELGDMFTVDSETVLVFGTSAGVVESSPLGYRNLDVRRGLQGTRKATHAAGSTLAAYSAGGGSSGVNVDNGTDPPAAVTTLVAPGADVGTPGTATLLNAFIVGPFTVSGDDPNLYADWVVLYPWPTSAVVLAVMVNVTADFVGTGVLHVRTNQGNSVYEVPNPAADGWQEILSNGLTPIAIGAATSHPSLSATIDTLGSAGTADIYAIVAVPAS